MIDTNGMALLRKRYLEADETPHSLFQRAAGGDETYYQLMEQLRFMPNSPTLFNAGRSNGCTLSACFVFNIADCMLRNDDGSINESSILRTREKAAMVAKAGGGVGYYFGDVRPKHSLIRSVQRKACGPVAVLRDMHGIHKLITQGGKRDLAQMGILPVTHPDIREFIHCKDEDPQLLSSFNISVSWDDASIESIGGDNGFADLWQEQCVSAWGHGCPGMFFVDTVNRANANPHLGLMLAPNPCGETPNRNNEPCNLGSLCLPRYFDRGNRSVDWKLLEEDAWNATLFLDDILERNEFPHPDIAAAALLTRKLGLGVMGWADLLAMMHVHYDSPGAVDLAHRVMGLIQEVSVGASEYLARVKRPYAGYSDRTEHPPRRNETTTSIAPTGSIGIICGVLGKGIEPWFAYSNSRETNEGMMLAEAVPPWVAEEMGEFRPRTAHEISWRWHIGHQAAFQRFTHLGVSKTINMANSATVEEVDLAYRTMHASGCKGGTVYRDGCRPEQVLRDTSRKAYTHGVSLPAKRPMPEERRGCIVKLRAADTVLFLTCGEHEDGALGEIFVNGDFGTTMAGLLDAFCITFSVALQNGTPLKDLVVHHRGKRFEPNGPTGSALVPVCTSIVDLICGYLEVRYLGEKQPARATGMLCGECGAPAVLQEGCLRCVKQGCGWIRCG